MQHATTPAATVCVAGGGPAGIMTGLLLARAGIEVVVLDKHADFLHDFRDDTVHPSTLEVLAELGLAERVLALRHRKARTIDLVRGGERHEITDLRRLGLRFPYIAFVPQWDLLNLLAGEARRLPNFRLLMRARVRGLLRERGRVAGVRYHGPAGEHDVRAAVTVAADGRHSTVRHAAGLRPRALRSPLDVVMFRLPRRPGDPGGCYQIHTNDAWSAVVIDRTTHWNVACAIRKGDANRIRARGIAALRDEVAGVVPSFADRVGELTGFDDVRFLDVRVNRLARWHRPGLLCIGDAAHAMSPMGGVGINLAVQDAVATANLLAAPLVRAQRDGGPVPESALAAVQRRRWLPTVATQTLQGLVQRHGVEPALRGGVTPDYRALLHSDAVRALLGRLIGVGVRPEHVHAEQIRTGAATPEPALVCER